MFFFFYLENFSSSKFFLLVLEFAFVKGQNLHLISLNSNA